jgi:ribosomal protein S18 acetylase RimI-like enzyme
VSGAGPVVVRAARDGELEAVGALTAAAYVADGLVEADHWYADELRDARTRAAQATLLVAVEEPTGDVLGTVTLARPGTRYAEVARPDEVELRMLAVDPARRGAGVAEQLVRGALRTALARGFRDVVLSTLDPMTAAQRLYARLGLVARPERDWSDEVTMRVHTWHAAPAPGVDVEVATWPPLRTADVDGWRVGLSRGVTRRASSTVADRDVTDLPAAVDRVEALYRADGAPATFRVGDPGHPAGLAAELDRRGYAVASLTDVLVRDVVPRPDRATVPGPGAARARTDDVPARRVRVADAPDDAWLDVWLRGKGGARDVSRAIVSAAPALYLTAADDAGRDVAVIRAALAGDWVGLSCLQVAGTARRQGWGRTLTTAALDAAVERGARRAFLQVEAHNVGALRLYEALGFRLAQGYAYRELAARGAADAS